MKKRGIFCFLLITVLITVPLMQAMALRSTTLTVGSYGTAVTKLQQALIDLGYLKGSADGKFGKMTEAAVRAFQAANGLTADGLAGTGTQNRLYSMSAQSQQVSTPQVTIAPEATAAPQPTATSAVSNGKLSFGGVYTTIRPGASGKRVVTLQTGLISLGYLSGKADGKFGKQTESAVCAFQRSAGLTADGLAGKKTLQALEKAYASGTSQSQPAATSTPEPTAAPTATPAPVQSTESAETYTNLSSGSKGNAVTRLQEALKNLSYSVEVTGTYDSTTRLAVIAFQQRNKLTADGVAGPKTQTVLYSGSAVTGDTSLPTLQEGAGKITPPSASQLKLLHWFNDIKPNVKSGQTILVYDPSSDLAWTLRLMSLGRHADSEPLTLLDTQIMEKAFGSQNTWNQKAVWVRLPSGTWTIASTHDMPHLSGSIKDNGFNGHLCVHFLRDMSECEKNDPNYGVENQKTIRKAWKALTGEEITY